MSYYPREISYGKAAPRPRGGLTHPPSAAPLPGAQMTAQSPHRDRHQRRAPGARTPQARRADRIHRRSVRQRGSSPSPPPAPVTSHPVCSAASYSARPTRTAATCRPKGNEQPQQLRALAEGRPTRASWRFSSLLTGREVLPGDNRARYRCLHSSNPTAGGASRGRSFVVRSTPGCYRRYRPRVAAGQLPPTACGHCAAGARNLRWRLDWSIEDDCAGDAPGRRAGWRLGGPTSVSAEGAADPAQHVEGERDGGDVGADRHTGAQREQDSSDR